MSVTERGQRAVFVSDCGCGTGLIDVGLRGGRKIIGEYPTSSGWMFILSDPSLANDKVDRAADSND